MILSFLYNLIVYYGGWQAILFTVIAFVFHRISEHQKIQWERNASEKIENIKAEIQKEVSLSVSLLSNSFYSHQKFTESRLLAIDTLWKTILRIPKIASPVYLYFQILTDDEIENKKFPEKIRTVLDQISMNKHLEEMSTLSETLNEFRPYIGEKLFFMFFTFRTAIWRSMHSLLSYKNQGKVVLWHKDRELIRPMLDKLYNDDALNMIIDNKVSTLDLLKSKMEEDILKEIHLILTGKSSITEGIENYSKIMTEFNEIEIRNKLKFHGV